jgi:hypothetical protein
MMRSSLRLVLSLSASAALAASAAAAYDGVWVSGSSSSAAGAEALELIDKARRSLGEGPELEIEYQTMPMLYKGSEDGILEGPTWGCYWTQNSCAHRTDVTLSHPESPAQYQLHLSIEGAAPCAVGDAPLAAPACMPPALLLRVASP